MTIKDEVEKFLKARGTPATPKYIAESLGKKQGDANVTKALRELVAVGKVIRKTRPVQNGWVTYEWNVNYRGTVVNSQGTKNKFTVDSLWRMRNGGKTRVLDIGDGKMVSYDYEAKHAWKYDLLGKCFGGLEECDIIAPWDETPKRSGEVWVNIYNGRCGYAYPKMAEKSRIARKRVTWTEGEFDE